MDKREEVVEIAKKWLKTPYVPGGRVMGAGTDCGMFLLEIFESAGLIPHSEVGYYAHDHHLHNSKEDYLGWVKKFTHEVNDQEPKPGDLILYKIGKCVSHGAMVIKYPLIIHACMGMGVVYGDADQLQWKSRQYAVYSYWGDE